jgi:hypothetical protein
MYASKTIRLYKDGDGFGYLWRWWNPITWILAPCVIVIEFAYRFLTEGVSGFDKEILSDVGITIRPFFKKNPEKLKWFK